MGLFSRERLGERAASSFHETECEKSISVNGTLEQAAVAFQRVAHLKRYRNNKEVESSEPFAAGDVMKRKIGFGVMQLTFSATVTTLNEGESMHIGNFQTPSLFPDAKDVSASMYYDPESKQTTLWVTAPAGTGKELIDTLKKLNLPGKSGTTFEDQLVDEIERIKQAVDDTACPLAS